MLRTPNPSGIRKCLGIVTLLVISLLLVSCLNLIMEKPDFTIRDIKFSKCSLTDMDLLLVIEVNNPNRFDFTIKSLQYSVYLNDREIGKGGLDEELCVLALSTTKIQMPVHAGFRDLGAGVKAFFTGEEIPYKIEGSACIKSFFGNSKLPFSKEGRVNLQNLMRGKWS
ncbi:MAG TPA: LEA type 2 family protein [Smithella sp.]|nr:LEA type 2 family protein [Smithella sp.]